MSANLFRTLGVRPLFGRDFVEEDDVEGARQTATLSHRFWLRRYGAPPDVVGSTVEIDGSPTVIIAVMPEGFELTSTSTSVWMPVARTRELLRRGPTSGAPRGDRPAAG